MIKAKPADKQVVLVNMYAPTVQRDRKAFYARLNKVPFLDSDCLLIGGDYNCTQQNLADRSDIIAANHH